MLQACNGYVTEPLGENICNVFCWGVLSLHFWKRRKRIQSLVRENNCNLSLCVMIHNVMFYLKLTIVTVKKENASKVARAGLASKEDIAQGKTKLTGVKDIREMGGSLAELLPYKEIMLIHVKGQWSEFIHPCQRSVVLELLKKSW